MDYRWIFWLAWDNQLHVRALKIGGTQVTGSGLTRKLVREFSKTLFISILSFSLFFNGLVFASSTPNSQQHSPLPNTLSHLPSSLINKTEFDPASMTKQEKELLEAHFQKPIEVAVEILAAFKKLYEKLELLDKEIGLEEIQSRIISGRKKINIEAEIKKVSKAEFLYLPESKVFIPRATHYGTNLSYLYLDGTGIEPSNPELRKFLNKQLFIGSQTEWEVYKGKAKKVIQEANPKANFVKKAYGREHIIVATGSDGKIEAEHIKKAPLGSLRRLKQWVQAAYERPDDRKAVELGLASGSAQFVLALTIEGIRVSMDEERPFQYAAAILSIIYGSVIGVFNKTYQNITYTGSTRQQTIKHWAISLSFSYALFSMTKDHFWSVTAMDKHIVGSLIDLDYKALAQLKFTDIKESSALYLHIWAFLNNIANNWARVHWNQIPRMRKLMGESTKEWVVNIPKTFSIPIAKLKRGEQSKIPIFKIGKREYFLPYQGIKVVKSSVQLNAPKFLNPGKDIHTGHSQDVVEAQGVYFGQYFIKIFDLVMGVPLLLMTIPIVATVNVLYAEKHKFKEAKHLRNALEKTRLNKIEALEAIPVVNKLYRPPYSKTGILGVWAIAKVPYTLPRKLFRAAKAYTVKKARSCNRSFK